MSQIYLFKKIFCIFKIKKLKEVFYIKNIILFIKFFFNRKYFI